MYIDVVPNRNSPPAVLLRESKRVGGKTVKTTLANLSALPNEAIAALRLILRGEQVTKTSAKRFAIERSRPCGHVRAIETVMERLGLSELVSSKPCRERDVVLAMLAQRVARPGSKIESVLLFEDSTVAQDFNVTDADVNELYAALDWLLARQGFIEQKLARRHLREGALVFYDVSSSSYHGRHCSLALRGKNRDGLSLPGIVYGLLTDADGRPITLRVYPGNTGDPTTVPDHLELLRRNFGVTNFIFVGDRGMLTRPQLAKLKEQKGCGWITCLRSSDIKKLLEVHKPAQLFAEHKVLAEITHPDFPGERLAACYNEFLARDRARKRDELLACTEELLQQLSREVKRRKKKIFSAAAIGLKAGKIINKYKVGKHFQLHIAAGSLTWERKVENIAREKELDGIYVVRTSVSAERLSTPDVVRAYKRLGDVEKAFRTFKGLDLRVRPIHHRLDSRVRAHLFLCMLAYYIEWHMRIALAPLLYVDEDLEAVRATRDPVAPAEPSAKSAAKRRAKKTEDGWQLRRWDGLLQTLMKITENTCRVGDKKLGTTFSQVTEFNAYQKQVFTLLENVPVWRNNLLCPVNGTEK